MVMCSSNQFYKIWNLHITSGEITMYKSRFPAWETADNSQPDVSVNKLGQWHSGSSDVDVGVVHQISIEPPPASQSWQTYLMSGTLRLRVHSWELTNESEENIDRIISIQQRTHFVINRQCPFPSQSNWGLLNLLVYFRLVTSQPKLGRRHLRRTPPWITGGGDYLWRDITSRAR